MGPRSGRTSSARKGKTVDLANQYRMMATLWALGTLRNQGARIAIQARGAWTITTSEGAHNVVGWQALVALAKRKPALPRLMTLELVSA
jgi:hypothetical protein